MTQSVISCVNVDSYLLMYELSLDVSLSQSCNEDSLKVSGRAADTGSMILELLSW